MIREKKHARFISKPRLVFLVMDLRLLGFSFGGRDSCYFTLASFRFWNSRTRIDGHGVL